VYWSCRVEATVQIMDIVDTFITLNIMKIPNSEVKEECGERESRATTDRYPKRA